MDKIIKFYFRQRIDQIYKSQSALTGETTLSAESIDISQKVREVLNISLELKTQRATALLEKKDLVDTTESKMDMLFQSIITSNVKEKNAKIDDIVALAVTYYNIIQVYSDSEQLQDLLIRASHVTKCMKLLKGMQLERKAIVTIIKLLHEWYIISYSAVQPEKSYAFLNIAMEIYSRYTKEEIEYPHPINFSAIPGLGNDKNSNSKITLEKLHLVTLLRMSNLYQKNFRDKHKFVMYVHNILDRLTERISYVSSTYYVHWAVTSSDLSQYFVHNHRFTEARNHLIAADYMMKMFYEKEITLIEEDDLKYNSKSYKYLCGYKIGFNNLLKCWGLYGAELLVASTNVLLQREEDNKLFDTDNSKSESFMDSKEALTKLLIFTDKKKNFENFTALFPDKYVSNFDEAKAIFLDVLKCFDRIKEYFVIKDYLVDFLEITIATSKVYKCLATFEQEKGRQIELHKQRTKFIGNVFSELETVNIGKKSIRLKIMAKISSELLVGYMNTLDIRTDHLQLNVEHLNKNFTEEIILRIKKPVLRIVEIFQSAMNMFNMLEKEL